MEAPKVKTVFRDPNGNGDQQQSTSESLSQRVRRPISRNSTTAAAPDPSLPPTKQHAQRVALAYAFEQELWHVCAPFVQTQASMRLLRARIQRFLPEPFVLVAYPGVPSDAMPLTKRCV